MRSLFAAFCPDHDDLEVRCLLALSLFIGSPSIAADHGVRSRADLLDLAMRRLLDWWLLGVPEITVTTRKSPCGFTTSWQNCIVDVEIRQMSWRLGDPVSADFAAKVAALMLDKVGMPCSVLRVFGGAKGIRTPSCACGNRP